ncbi:short chain dehydrogenase [Striga asiatica]|uniref:Short chain dehydrogenase n=1 Tax=Striga asiatica TaxID=4170 RepID=A0A5A7R1P3_STRAF|nr:short chain dehydrogenase [Striga asiatica]
MEGVKGSADLYLKADSLGKEFPELSDLASGILPNTSLGERSESRVDPLNLEQLPFPLQKRLAYLIEAEGLFKRSDRRILAPFSSRWRERFQSNGSMVPTLVKRQPQDRGIPSRGFSGGLRALWETNSCDLRILLPHLWLSRMNRQLVKAFFSSKAGIKSRAQKINPSLVSWSRPHSNPALSL